MPLIVCAGLYMGSTGVNSGTMIRSDYILRMIEEFMQALSRIRALKKDEKIREAFLLTDEEFKRITDLDSEALLRLSETELMARLIQSDSAHAVRDKMFFLTTLLLEAGDMAVAQGRMEDSRACYLKGLHLLLNSLSHGDGFEQPEFVPKVELFVAALADEEMPTQTSAMLMEYYERTGQFAKAEDALFAILEGNAGNVAALDFGISFYKRLEGKSDIQLGEGNLPRTEVEEGLRELEARRGEVGKP